MPQSVQSSSNLFGLLVDERYLADAGVVEVALGRLKWMIVAYVFEIFRCASARCALGLARCW